MTMNWYGAADGLLLYSLVGLLFVALVDPEDTEQPMERWLLEWPGCIYRAVREP